MGPMMPAFGGTGIVVLTLAGLLLMAMLIVVAVVALTIWRRDQMTGASRPTVAPADLLRQRYARGEITRDQYRQTLLDLLQDRYARGEIDLVELEARAKPLIAE